MPSPSTTGWAGTGRHTQTPEERDHHHRGDAPNYRTGVRRFLAATPDRDDQQAAPQCQLLRPSVTCCRQVARARLSPGYQRPWRSGFPAADPSSGGVERRLVVPPRRCGGRPPKMRTRRPSLPPDRDSLVSGGRSAARIHSSTAGTVWRGMASGRASVHRLSGAGRRHAERPAATANVRGEGIDGLGAQRRGRNASLRPIRRQRRFPTQQQFEADGLGALHSALRQTRGRAALERRGDEAARTQPARAQRGPP